MQPSSSLCRAQEARQLDLAEGSQLENVRSVAMLAAAAWSKEAVLAEKREQRLARNQTDAGLSLDTPDMDEDDFNENPDASLTER